MKNRTAPAIFLATAFAGTIALGASFIDTGNLHFVFKTDSEDEVEVNGCSTSATDVSIPSTVVYKYIDRHDGNVTKYRTCHVIGISNRAFSKCKILKTVSIPSSVRYIDMYAFLDCSGLASVTIAEGMKSIGVGAFSGCSSLTSVTIPHSMRSIGPRAFYGCKGLYDTDSIPGVQLVDGWAVGSSDVPVLFGALDLTGVRGIGGEAFKGCSGLVSVNVGNGVAIIPTDAFAECTSLTSVTVPASVTEIWSHAFENCTSLRHMCFLGDPPEYIGQTNFPFHNNAFFHVIVYHEDDNDNWPESWWEGCPVRAISEKKDEEDSDHLWSPHPRSLTITGEAKSDDETQSFLVAGSNATARIELAEFKPCHKWQAYCYTKPSDPDELWKVSGQSRHVITNLTIVGRPKLDFPAPGEDGYESLALDWYIYHGFDFPRHPFSTPATKDLVFTYELKPTSEGSETYSIVSATDPNGNAIDTSREEPTGENGVFMLPMKLPKGRGFHGAYWWTAEVGYSQDINVLETKTLYPDYPDICNPDIDVDEGTYDFGGRTVSDKDTKISVDGDGMVFFEKYGQDTTGVPNWFTYWKEDGACPGLKNSKYKIKIDRTLEDGYFGWYDNSKKEVLINKIAEKHYTRSFEVTSPQFHRFSGPHIWGIYTIEEVVAHELSHAEREASYRKLFLVTDSAVDYWVLSAMGIDDSDYRHDNNQNYAIYWIPSFNGKKREYCDNLFDIQEKMYGLNEIKTDTYGIGRIKGFGHNSASGSEYTAYGDDEFLAMVAANEASDERRAVWEKDWAFPGEQSYIPQAVREARNAVGWDRDGYGPPRSWSSLRSGTRQAALLLNSASAKGTEDDGVPSFSVTDFTKEIIHEEGQIASINYTMGMEASGFQSLGLHGVLTDGEGNTVAHANTEAPNGNSTVELRFSGEEIYRSGREGPFRLDHVILSEHDGYERTDFATLTDFQDAEVDVRRSDLIRKDAYLLGVVEESAFTDGIKLTVEIEVNTPGRYEIAATLGTDDKAEASSCSVEGDYVAGTNRVQLRFWPSGIYGKCTMNSIVLNHEGVQVESRLDFYTLRKLYWGNEFYDFEGKWANATPEEFMAQFADYVPPKWFWVFFNPNGGTTPEFSREVQSGRKVGTLPVPTSETAEFVGWFTEVEGGIWVNESTIVTTNVMFHAHWAKSGTSSTNDWVVADGNGNGNGGATTGGQTGAGGATAVPEQTYPDYTVAFNKNGGKLPKGKSMAPQTFSYGTAAKLNKNVFTKKGYVFAGWAVSQADAKKGVIAYENAQEVRNLRTDGGTTTLYAVWAKPTYKVAFVANGGKGKMAAQTFKYGKAAKLTANKFKRKGYTFKGWATSKANAKKNKVAYKNKAKVKNLLANGKTVKLYAVWKKR